MESTNLQRLSAITIAIKIWETPIIENQIRDLFLQREAKNKLSIKSRSNTDQRIPKPRDNSSAIKMQYKKFHLIINSAIKILDSFELPEILTNYCKDIVRELGEKMYEWCEYVTEGLFIDFKFAEKIFWKPDAIIDEDKIFEIWESDEDFLNHETPIGPAMFTLAWVNVRESYIVNNYVEMDKWIKKNYSCRYSEQSNKVDDIIASYLCVYISHQYQVLNRRDQLTICSQAGLKKGALYTWKFIPEHNTIENAYDCLNDRAKEYARSQYQEQKSAEVLIFLINEMAVEEKNQFLENGGIVVEVFCRILPVLPDHDIIHDLIDNHFWKLSANQYQEVFKNIFYFTWCRRFLSKTKIKIYKIEFYKIFQNLSDDLKKQIFSEEFFKSILIDYTDLDCLKLITSNLDENVRAEFIEFIQKAGYFIYQIETGYIQIENIHKFMQDILISDDERCMFKKYILSQIDGILRNANFETVEKLFQYFSLSAEEISTYKQKIDCLSVCQSYIKYKCRYDKAEKFLEWMFPNMDEREIFKNSLSDEFFIYEKTFNNCSPFLKIFFGPDGNRDDFFNYFFGYTEEEKLINDSEKYLKFRKEVEDGSNTLIRNLSPDFLLEERVVAKKKFFPSSYYDLYDKCEVPYMFMRWISKDKDRRDFLKRKYDNDCDKDFFRKLVFLMLG